MNNPLVKKAFLALFGLVFAGMGFFALVTAGNAANDYKDLTANGTKTSATVTQVNYDDKVTKNNNKRKTTTYESTIITYKDAKGQDHTIKDRKEARGTRATVGQKHTVYYDSENPSHAVVEGKNDSGTGKLLGILFITIGLGITAGSGISFLRNRNP